LFIGLLITKSSFFIANYIIDFQIVIIHSFYLFEHVSMIYLKNETRTFAFLTDMS